MVDGESTFWRLDSRLGWKTADSPGIAIGSRDGLRLDSACANDLPSGPLSLGWPDGSLGGTLLPRGMAQAQDGQLYLISREEQVIKRYDPERRGFIALPSIGMRKDRAGRRVRDNRTFMNATALAISGRLLYVVDEAEQRVQVFSTDPPYLLVHLWKWEGFQPVDVAAHAGTVYVLDGRGKVYRQRAGSDHLHPWIHKLGEGEWARIAVDREGVICLLDKKSPRLLRYDLRGKPMMVKNTEGKWVAEGPLGDAGDIRDNFDAPAIRLRSVDVNDPWSGKFCLPEGRAWCGGTAGSGPEVESPMAGCLADTQVRERNDYRLTAQDLRDLPRLADRLRRPRSAADHAIRDGMAEVTRTALADWLPGLPLSAELSAALLEELNGLVLGPSLGEEKAFADGQLPDWTRDLLHRSPLDEVSTAQLNRLLLEAVFPLELHRGPLTNPGGLVFSRSGEPASFAMDEPMGPYLYAREGCWWTVPLDSEIYRCQWHRIELDLAAPLPPGARVTVYTYSSDEKTVVLPLADSSLWVECGSFVGEIQQKAAIADEETQDVLVQSREGQYLAVLIKMEGSGYGTPRIRSLRVHYPRTSYLSYLPAIFSADDESRWFLERFLSIFQTEWDGLERQIARSTALFDPAAVPANFLESLAGWLGMPLEGTWDVEQKRNLLKAAPQFTPKRGTPQGLREYFQVYLKNLSRAEVEKLPVFPLLLEGYRERQRVILASQSGNYLNRQALLWGPAQVGRLQLDVFASESEVRLVSTGDPERDLFYEYANRFRVYVPSAWVRTATDEQMLRRAIEAEKPAHTDYDLCLVEPRFRVGIQAMVGLNTIIGQLPVLRLPCAETEQDAPPSQAPRGRLGYDTVLGGTVKPEGSVYQVGMNLLNHDRTVI